jgi:hypothetical protein
MQDLKKRLEITAEKVLEAASKCETAKATLKTLFPEVFVATTEIKELKGHYNYFKEDGGSFDTMIAIRMIGDMAGRCFYLNSFYEWKLAKDNHDVLCLIPTKK